MAIAIYAGTFDPITAGHLSVIREGARLFAHVVVVVAVNPNKHTLLDAGERVRLIRGATALMPNVRCHYTEGLVVEFARTIGATVLLRGVRGATDAQFETELAQQNRALAPEISTLFLPAAAELAIVSSSELKARLLRGEDVSSFCTPEVERAIRERLQPGGTPTRTVPQEVRK
jgi:pantetheine-phosphate adenylyltransferase